MSIRNKDSQTITLSSKQMLRLFMSMMVMLVIFGVALMSDIGWLWSFLAAHGALFWFRIFWDGTDNIVSGRVKV